MRSKKRNLLYVIHYPVYGGPHNRAVTLDLPLEKLGYETYVLIPDSDGNAASRLTSHRIKVKMIELHRLRASLSIKTQIRFIVKFPSEVATIRKIIRKLKTDIVIVCGFVNPHAAFAARLEKKAVVWHVLDTRTPWMLRALLFPLIYFLSDIIMCTGKRVAELHPGLSMAKNKLIYHFAPVDTELFKSDYEKRNHARLSLNIPKDIILIGTIGNLNPQKGHEVLIAVAKKLSSIYPDIFLRILGESTPTHIEYELKLKKLINTCNLRYKEQFKIINPDNRIPELLPAFDIFLLTAVKRSEGIPTVILEAMSCGIPVISNEVGSVGEIIQNHKTGYIVRNNDLDDIFRRVQTLIDDKELRLRMGQNARRRVVRDFNLEKCTEIHRIAFEKALLRKKRC